MAGYGYNDGDSGLRLERQGAIEHADVASGAAGMARCMSAEARLLEQPRLKGRGFVATVTA